MTLSGSRGRMPGQRGASLRAPGASVPPAPRWIGKSPGSSLAVPPFFNPAFGSPDRARAKQTLGGVDLLDRSFGALAAGALFLQGRRRRLGKIGVDDLQHHLLSTGLPHVMHGPQLLF